MALFLWRIRTVCVKQQDETETQLFRANRQKQTYFQSQAVKRRARHYNISISGKFQRFSRASGYDGAAASEQKSGECWKEDEEAMKRQEGKKGRVERQS